MMFLRLVCIAIACLAGVGERVGFAESETVDYLTQVKPLLRERCYACHGALKQESGLRLDTAAFIRQGGDSGVAITPGEAPEKSLLIERVADTEPASRMPPEFEGEPLNAQQLDLLKKWIAAGAPAPADEAAEADPTQHWAFQPIKRPEVPTVKNSAWVRNPIDAWIAKGHEEHALIPQEEASRVQLLRRLSFDLIGLPPTAEEIAECLSDPTDAWYEQTVDRLLNDPRHGERWARHWMDNWRYSDWWGLGAQLRNSQRHMWHWRDWIVESLNEDAPYDEMVRLMLAADELAPGDPEKLRATGYLARNFYIFNRTKWMDDTVEHVGKGFLGLTMNCAKCHDHKFDPIDHVDYYKMRAFFEPYLVRLDMVPGETDVDQNGIPRVFDALLDAPTYRFIRGDDAQPDKSTVIAPGVPKLLEFDTLKIEQINLPAEAWQPAREPGILESHIAAARDHLKTQEANVRKATEALEAAQAKPSSPLVDAVREDAEIPPVIEDFTTLDASRWKIASGEWAHRPGELEQSMDGQSRAVLQLLQQAPQNFDATLRFRINGAGGYRSVGIGFDAPVDSASVSQFLVYVSGHEGGSKVQASYQENGTSHYPGDGRQATEVKLGTEYTLHLQVRGTLVNAALNGQPSIAWRSPVSRQPGAIQLVTFDALATIFEFKLFPLEDSVELRDAKSGSPSVGDPVAEAKAKLAEANRKAAEALAELESVQARASAMQAAWTETDATLIRETHVAAIRAERQLALVRAENLVATEQLSLERATADKKADAEKKFKAAQEALSKAQTLVQAEVSEDEQYSPLPGAKWTATRFLFTGRDDPEVTFPKTSTGRRAALAKWITDRRNPLTARVAANHIWTRHFGQPLVASTFDFGRNGATPTHPDLLDWLASELMDNGWSMKHLHRLIVMSSTYRMGSSTTGMEDQLAKDQDNHYWWRRTPIRLESQAVRDSVLANAGTLDETMGGPSVPPNAQENSHRRSLYFFHSNNERNLLLTTFDEASVSECYVREQSIVPQQALALSNSGLVLESSQQIASHISAAYPDNRDFIRQGFLVLLGIEASPQEIASCEAALTAWQDLPDATTESARANLIWALINHNDFVTLR